MVHMIVQELAWPGHRDRARLLPRLNFLLHLAKAVADASWICSQCRCPPEQLLALLTDCETKLHGPVVTRRG